MFTGIVQGVRAVVDVEQRATTRLRIGLGDLSDGLETGASVAVNGVCLTAAAIEATVVAFDVIAETIQTTNLGTLTQGSTVNVERSFRVGDEVGGHILSGHVAATAEVVEVAESPGGKVVTAQVPPPWLRYLMAKGFVALNGASLTIQELDRSASTLKISLIPETLARTTFATVAPGNHLNLEVDAQTQAVVDTVAALLPELLPEALAQAEESKHSA